MIEINYKDSRPINEQIKEGIRKLIVTGVIQQGEKLPSVRELATAKALNPNTIQRAYRELEAEGYIYSVPGKGSFAADLEDVLTQRQEDLWPVFENAARDLLQASVSAKELKQRIDALAGGKDKL